MSKKVGCPRETKMIKGKCKPKLEMIVMAPDPFGGDPLEKYYGDTYSVKEANEFLEKAEGGGARVEWKRKIVGYNWGELKKVRLKKGKPLTR